MFGGKIMKWILGNLSMLKLSRMIKHHLDNKTDKESIIKLIRQTFLFLGPHYEIYLANIWMTMLFSRATIVPQLHPETKT